MLDDYMFACGDDCLYTYIPHRQLFGECCLTYPKLLARRKCRPDVTQTLTRYQGQKPSFRNAYHRQLHNTRPTAQNTAVALSEITLQLVMLNHLRHITNLLDISNCVLPMLTRELHYMCYRLYL